MNRRIWMIAALTVLAAACNDDDDAANSTTIASSTTSPPASTSAVTTAGAPSTLVATTPPLATTTVTTTAGVPTTGVASCSQAPTFDAGGSLRDQFVGYLIGCGFTPTESACLFDNLDFDDPAVLSGDTDAMLPAFQACDIDASRMAEIGRA